MSTDTKQEAVHIYLKPEEQKNKDLFKSCTVHEKYIIQMNDTLQVKNEENIVRIKELEMTVDDIENQVDRSDVSRNNLKGLVKNFHEMHKWNERILKLEESMHKETRDSIYSFKQKAWWHQKLLYCGFILLLGMTWENSSPTDFGVLLIVTMSVTAFQQSQMYNLRLPSFQSKQQEKINIVKDKAEVNKAQDYIYEFIDSQ